MKAGNVKRTVKLLLWSGQSKTLHAHVSKEAVFFRIHLSLGFFSKGKKISLNFLDKVMFSTFVDVDKAWNAFTVHPLGLGWGWRNHSLNHGGDKYYSLDGFDVLHAW